MRFGVLGPLIATSGAQELRLGGPRQRAVLAVLLANANSPVSADVVIEAVYHDDPPGKPRQAVSQSVSSLRNTLGDCIETVRDGWSLMVAREDLDSLLFSDVVDRAAAEPDAGTKSRQLRDALELWRGHPYSDVETYGYLEPERSSLNEKRLAAIESLNEAELELGHHRELVGPLEALVAEHPYREALRSQHMVALYRSGRQAEALRSFTTLRETLVNELGVEPSKPVSDLEQRILEQDESLLLPEAPQVRRRVVMVADPGDPRDTTSVDWLDRVEVLHRTAIEAVEDNGGEVHSIVGVAIFTSFGSARDALSGLIRATADTRAVGGHIRAVLDEGDVESSDGSIAGPPVVRAGRLLSGANNDQVLLAGPAHEALSRSGESGWTASSLGTVDLPGVDSSLAVYQLQTPGLPQELRPVLRDTSPIRLPSSRTLGVAGYEIREQLGPGAVGQLHLAYHPSSGREVWIEIIPDLQASDGNFISRFEAVMQRVSSLDHSNLIVPIDHWRDPDGAYVVYPRHRGTIADSSTGEHMNHRNLSAVLGALSHAHQRGVVHGTLSMSRIYFDETGHPYVFGFSSGLKGTVTHPPRYRAPEVVLEPAPSIEADAYSVGVIAYEWLSGQEVPEDASIPPTGLGSAVDDAIVETIAENPQRRISGLDALRASVSDDQVVSARRRDLRNPYKGLTSFQESDAGDFYGRDQAIRELNEAATTHSLVTVVGPSGIGKSSLVKAGLAPQVRSGLLGEGEWLVTQMTPGEKPFDALRRALTRIAVLIPVSVDAQFAQSDPDLIDAVERMLPAGAKALLVVDQFEELYTMTADATERVSFLDFLEAASQPESPIRVVLTLRADYLDYPLSDPEHGDLIRRGLVPLRAPNRTELREAIVRPAESVGLRVDADFAERLVGEVIGQPGALPLTQLMLTGLFEERETDRLSVADYERVGGVNSSMTDTADLIYSELDPAGQSLIRQTFLRLLVVGEDSVATRRRAPLSALPARSHPILQSFAAARLCVYDHDPVTRERTVEVAHEALIGGWPRLAGWVETMRGDLMLRRRLDEAMADWKNHDEENPYLLTAQQLAQHDEWVPESQVELSVDEANFLEKSRTWVEAQEAEIRKRRRRVLAGFATAAVVASALGIATLFNASEASAQRTAAEANALAGFSGAVLGEDSELALLLAIHSVEKDSTQAGIQALQDALQTHRHRRALAHAPPIDPGITPQGVMSPDGRWVVSVDEGTAVKIWDLEGSDQPLKVIEYTGATGRFSNLIWFEKDSTSFLIETSEVLPDGITVLDYRIYTVPEGEMVLSVSAPSLPCYGLPVPSQGSTPFIDLTRPLLLVTPDPADDGTCPEAGPGTVWSFDLQSGTTEALWAGHSQGYPPTVSDDWNRLAVDLLDRGEVIDLSTGEVILELPAGHSELSGDGSMVLTGFDPIEVVKVDDGSVVSNFSAGDIVYFGLSGNVVYAPFPGTSRVIDVETGDILYEVDGTSTGPYPITLSEDGRTLFSNDLESMVVSDISSKVIGHTEAIAMNPRQGVFLEGRMGVHEELVTSLARPNDGDRATHVFDMTTGQWELAVEGIGGALSPDGGLLAVQSRPEIVELSDDQTGGNAGSYYVYGSVILVDPRTGELVRELDGLCTWFNSLAHEVIGPECAGPFPEPWQDWVSHIEFSPDGSLLAMGGWSDRIAVWETDTGSMVWALDTLNRENHFYDRGLPSVTFSPDGSNLVVTQGALQAGPGRMLVVDTADWKIIAEPELPDLILDAEFAADGSLLFAGTAVAETLYVYDAETWQPRDLGSQGDWIQSVSVSPDSSRVATATPDGQIWIWDVESGSVVQKVSLPAPPDLYDVAFLDGETILVKTGAEIVTLFLDTDRLMDVARARLTRTLTADECATYDIDPCPSLEELRAG